VLEQIVYRSSMPIVQVTALRQRVGIDLGAVSSAIAAAVGSELGEGPSGTWVTWQTLDPGTYREGLDSSPGVQPASTHPPLVRISAFEGRPPELVQRVLSAVAGTLVRELGLEPGNVFVVWDELRAGRVHTGGTIPTT
jgi:phenylpyruvate tautomerase PptA (4-oxalocrotonate tautomerase family)